MPSRAIETMQIRACALVWSAGRLLVQSARTNQRTWALPGGRLEKGETLEECLRREFREEMAITLRPGRLLFVNEHFFRDEGRPTQEYGFYFLCEAEEPAESLDQKTASPVETQLVFRWITPDEANSLVLYPEFLKHYLRELPTAPLFLRSDHVSSPPRRADD